MRTLAVALLLLLGACGGSGSDGAATAPSSTATSTAPLKVTPTRTVRPTPTPTPATPTGTPAPEALSTFQCGPDAAGAWSASGILANSAKTKVTYQVTVYVGPEDGTSGQARTVQVPSVAGSGSVPLTVTGIPAPTAGGTCHVQVLATR